MVANALDPDARPALEAELDWLRRAEAHGVPVAPMAVVTAAVEGDFYRLAGLEARVAARFANVDPVDPDEDDLEDLAPEVARWVLDAALLVEVVEGFYEALSGLPSRVIVRRPGLDGRVSIRGRPALVAVKRTWAADWSPPEVARRIARGGVWMPPPRPVLVHAAALHVDPEATRAASTTLGREVAAWCDDHGRLARLALP
jgi:hypothetical protein